MQPDSIKLAAATIPSFIISDDIALPIETFTSNRKPRVRSAIERAQPLRFHEAYYRQNPSLFQSLDGCPASQDAGCVFYAAVCPASGRFFGQRAAVAESATPWRHLSAINVDGRLISHPAGLAGIGQKFCRWMPLQPPASERRPLYDGNLMCAADAENSRTTAVTFILASYRLVTTRYDEPKFFVRVARQPARSCAAGVTVEMVLIEMPDAVMSPTGIRASVSAW